MPQTRTKPQRWVFNRNTIDFIPLTVKVLGDATLAYTIQVQPHGVDVDLGGTWTTPDEADPETGYKVNGPTLSGGEAGEWLLYTKIDDAPLVPIDNPVIIRLT